MAQMRTTVLKWSKGRWTYQMPEVTCDHELQRLGRARRIASDHGIPGHDLANGRDMRINSLRRNLHQHIITQ